MNEIKTIPIRKIDFVFSTRDFGDLLLEAELLFHKRGSVRTVLCKGASTAAFILSTDDGAPRTYIFRENGELDWPVAEDLIRRGIHYLALVDEGEEIPMVAGASYFRHKEEMIFQRWGATRVTPSEETEGYVCWSYFDGDVYLGPDTHGIYPVFIRAIDEMARESRS